MRCVQLDVRIIGDELHQLLQGMPVGAEHQVVIGAQAPVAVRIEVIIALALLVGLFDQFPGLILVNALHAHDALHLVLLRGVDEHMGHVGPAAEHIIGAAAHKHARAFLRQLGDGVELRLKNALVHGHLHSVAHAAHGAADGGRSTQKAAEGAFFVMGLHHFFADAALLRRPGQDGFVVIGDAKPPGKHLAKLPSAAAVFASNGNNQMLSHLFSSRSGMMIRSIHFANETC